MTNADRDREDQKTLERRRDAIQAIRVGVVLLICGLATIGLAIFLGTSIAKYLVVIAFVLASMGVVLLLNGLWDKRRSR